MSSQIKQRLTGPDEWLRRLIERAAVGDPFPLLPFYGHRMTADGAAGPWMASQWAPLAFTVGGVRYPHAEAWMMAQKARLFGDDDALNKILAEPDPGRCKRLGRLVRGFDATRWQNACYRIVAVGTWHKFRQNPAAADWLAGTAPAVLVEAAPRDRIWGAGLGRTSPLLHDPARWPGRNLLGFALTEVRGFLPRAPVTT
jgi:ribA/ribD-fused uncharacterized protein